MPRPCSTRNYTYVSREPLKVLCLSSAGVRAQRIHRCAVIPPLRFLGGPGIRLRYDYASGIGIAKKGSCVMRVIGGKLYAMKLESIAGQNFDSVAPEFDELIASAQLR